MTERDDFPTAVDIPLVAQSVRQPARWVRGTASFRGEESVLELDPRTVEEYVPMELELYQQQRGEPGVLLRLANLRTSADAVGVATDYGLLHVGPGSVTFRESYDDWLRVSRRIREVLELRDALRRRDRDRMEALVAPYRPIDPDVIGRKLKLVEEASILIAGRVNHGLTGTEISLLPGPRIIRNGFPEDPELFTYAPAFTTLEGYVSNDLAIVLSRRVDVLICAAPDCQRAFKPRRTGQDYHSPACSSRHRQQRRRAKS